MKSFMGDIWDKLKFLLDDSLATKDRPVQFRIITIGFLLTAIGCIAYSIFSTL